MDILEKARQHGDLHANGKWYWNSSASGGKGDWRTIPKTGVPDSSGDTQASNDDTDGGSADPAQKLATFLKKTNDKSLIQFAKKEGNDPKLRQAAYDELVERGVDVSDINMNNGKLGKMKQAFGKTNAKPSAPKAPAHDDDTISYDYGQIPADHKASEKTWQATIDFFEGDSIDYSAPELIKKVFGNLKTKAQRIEYDKFISDYKKVDPYYLTPDEEIIDLNESYLQALDSGAPFLIASGGAGVGKSYNFKLVAEICNLKQFDPDSDAPGDGDYDWIEAPDVKGDKQFFELLKLHNGKTIVFDDADGIYGARCIDLLKKATNPSGKRIVGVGNESINFTGQIISITNMNSGQLTEDEDLKAVYSRADKKDIYFTKEEQMQFIESRLHDMNFDALSRLPNQAEDIAEREEVFKILKDNIDAIDPIKFNARTLKDAITAKRKSEGARAAVANKGALAIQALGASGTNWKKNLLRQITKGEEDQLNSEPMSFQKALEVFSL